MFEIYLNPTSSLKVKIKGPVEIVIPKGNTYFRLISIFMILFIQLENIQIISRSSGPYWNQSSISSSSGKCHSELSFE